MIHENLYPYNDEEIRNRLISFEQKPLRFMNENEALRFILNCIDLTTLEGSDNKSKIDRLCQKSLSFIDPVKETKGTAAVCVYPPFVAQCKKNLSGTPIKVASVAGAFPAGQSPISIKMEEIKYALDEGADEIDMVISRGKFLEGKYSEVFDEIASIKDLCGSITLKVILETGELITPANIYKASLLAMEAGGDFIKTSTGKIAVNATPESFLIMLDAIKFYFEKTKKVISIKPAGGITDTPTALLFLRILENVLGEKWLSNKCFRIGASRLADTIFESVK